MVEIATIKFDPGWSPVLHDHHAITIDARNKIIYIPFNSRWGVGGGVAVISYANNTLKLVKILEHASADRTVYIDTKLYTISSTTINVYDRETYELLKVIELT